MTETKVYTIKLQYEVTDVFEGRFHVRAASEKEAIDKLQADGSPHNIVSHRFVKNLKWKWIGQPVLSPTAADSKKDESDEDSNDEPALPETRENLVTLPDQDPLPDTTTQTILPKDVQVQAVAREQS